MAAFIKTQRVVMYIAQSGRPFYHDEVITWKHFPDYKPLVSGLMDSICVCVCVCVCVWGGGGGGAPFAGYLPHRGHYGALILYFF